MKSVVALIALVALPSVSSLKCYSCDDCADSKGEEKTCSAGFDQCLKVEAKVDGKKKIGHECANETVCELAKIECDTLKKCDMGCCDSDLCNAGAAPSLGVLVVSLCSLVAVVPFLK